MKELVEHSNVQLARLSANPTFNVFTKVHTPEPANEDTEKRMMNPNMGLFLHSMKVMILTPMPVMKHPSNWHQPLQVYHYQYDPVKGRLGLRMCPPLEVIYLSRLTVGFVHKLVIDINWSFYYTKSLTQD
jgi:hypothetical protein